MKAPVLFALIALAGLSVVACDKKPEGTGASPSASAASTAPSASAAAVASASAAPGASSAPTAARGVPSQADEAIAASKEIDKSNYKKELDALEQDLK